MLALTFLADEDGDDGSGEGRAGPAVDDAGGAAQDRMYLHCYRGHSNWTSIKEVCIMLRSGMSVSNAYYYFK